nr:hypothetical protein [Mucilaginibacter sp. FT3.2]
MVIYPDMMYQYTYVTNDVSLLFILYLCNTVIIYQMAEFSSYIIAVQTVT